MKAVGSARKSNKQRLALSKRLDKKTRAAATECMVKMLTGEVVRQKCPWKNWGWIKSTKGDVEYHAFWRGPDAATHANYCAFNLIYEDGHFGDQNYICGLAQLSRPSTCCTRWALLKWVLDLQLIDALLEKIVAKERPAPRLVKLGALVDAYCDDPDNSRPETLELLGMCQAKQLTAFEFAWVQRSTSRATMEKACALSESNERKATTLFTEAVRDLAEVLAETQKLVRKSLLADKAKPAADAVRLTPT